ncbi:MAG: hypothetical protein ACR2QF_03215 [Geminicoccaceae bacterium]
MLRNSRNFIYKHNNSGHNIMETHEVYKLEEAPVANQEPVSKVVVRRGPQLMVVLAGYPENCNIEALLQAGVKVGLALTSAELANAPKLDDYSFVFVGMSHKPGSPLKQAIADLAHNGWSIDDTWRSPTRRPAPYAPETSMQMTELAIA